MSPKTSTSMSVSEFGRFIDVNGADRTRWPLSARASAASLLAVNAEARRILAEADALDAVLSRAVDVGGFNLSELSARIVANRGDQVVAQPDKTGLTGVPVRRVQHSRAEFWPGAALLAASLMIGIMLGQSQLIARALPAFEIIGEITGSSDRLVVLDLPVDTIDDD
jgi:hypothetical protein